MGTGVVIDQRGYILTNHHVVEGVKKIQVTLLSGESFTAKLVSHDPLTDLAVIKINAKEKLPVVTIGTSSDLMLAEPTIAIGNAYGYGHTVTEGIISELHRTVQVSDTQQYQDLIQTNASINPGNSGGPLLNIDGEMIGINVAVRAGAQGIGFAIPVDMAMRVAADLMSVDRLNNLYHGVRPTHDPESPIEFVVGEVEENSPAAKIGLRSGDVITAVNDKPVKRALDFERDLLDRKAGDEVRVTVKRDRQPMKLNLVLAPAPKKRKSSIEQCWELLGLKLEPIPASQFRPGKTAYTGGLSVLAVRPDSPAARQGVRQGDILVGMHKWRMAELDDVAYVLNRPDFSELQPLRFRILRNDDEMYGHMTVSLRR